MKNILIALGVLIIIGGGAYYFMNSGSGISVDNTPDPTTLDSEPVEEVEGGLQVVTPTESEPVGPVEVLGSSAGDNDITAYHYGDGDTELLFIGGIHGAYSWNTALVAYELMDYLDENPDVVPDNLRVTIIPVLNPDGLSSVVGSVEKFNPSDITTTDSARVAGRFNANEVDLNRNFDCEWNETGTWQNKAVSGGSAPFSEPESKVIKNYVDEHNPVAVITWYSAAGGVYSSNCNTGVSTETKELTNLYAQASGYKAFEEFDYYEITGDMVNWFAKENIPAISVLLTDRNNTDWSKNKAGVEAVINKYAE